MKRTLTVLIALTTLTLCLAVPAFADEKVTFCHGTGLDDTIHFVSLTIAAPAVYGPAGHFEENGTPRAGHEADYFGFCAGDEATTTTTTTVPGGDGTTTTTLPGGDGTTTTTTVSGLEVSGETQVAGISVTAPVAALTSNVASVPVAASPALTELPFTGVSTTLLAGLALAFASAGTCLLMVQRSREVTAR